MRLSAASMSYVHAAAEVAVGNVYPTKGGKGPTQFWVVVALTENGACLIGFDKDGLPCSTASYLKGALRERPVIARVNLENIVLEVVKGDL